MLISDDSKFVFLHNPKCAGTSVRSKLMKLENRNNLYWMFDEVNNCKIDKAHMSLSKFQDFNSQDYELLNDYFVFGFVRNPYSRIISAFNETHIPLYKQFNADLEGNDYILQLNNFCRSLNKNNTLGNHLRFRHCIQQHRIFYMNNKCKADLIIKLEDIGTGLDKLKILHPRVYEAISDLHKSKKNQKPLAIKPEEILSEESLEHIRVVYSKDFSLFEYEK